MAPESRRLVLQLLNSCLKISAAFVFHVGFDNLLKAGLCPETECLRARSVYPPWPAINDPLNVWVRLAFNQFYALDSGNLLKARDHLAHRSRQSWHVKRPARTKLIQIKSTGVK